MTRENHIKYLQSMINDAEDLGLYDEDIESLQEAIKALEQEPKTGHWSRKTRVENVYDIAGVKTWGIKCQCDRCSFTTIVVEGFGYYKYCPNCGCRMESEK